MSPSAEPGGSVAAEQSAIGARLDRLPWSAQHTTILLALGAGWMFDSVEVQLFASAVGPLGDSFGASVLQRDAVLAVWLSGILLGALAGGRLTDAFGRRRLFVATLLWYAGFTVLTGLAPSLGAVYVLRFLAALGVGAEYAIVNAAIAEFVPARVRGRAGAAVMSFWPAGAILAALLAHVLLDVLGLAAATSWRFLFVLGGLLALVVLVFRRRIPESPRWLAARGRSAEAEAVVAALERASGQPAGTTAAVAAPAAPGLAAAWRELAAHHRGRLVLGCVLDLAEAFGYYGVFALLSVVVLPQVHLSSAQVPLFYVVGNAGALAGGLVVAGVLDRLGHRLTVTTSYTAAAAGVGLLAAATATGSAGWVTAAFVVANAFATAAWISAYPTFTELFPTALRGAGVGTCVAVGRAGAIVGTLVLPSVATAVGATASYLLVVAFWLVGAAAMAVWTARGGTEAARRPLESLVPLGRSAAAPST